MVQLLSLVSLFAGNTYQKPYSTTTMLLILFGVTAFLILIQWLIRKKKDDE